MEYRGRVKEGIIVFEGELKPPEGAEVTIRVVPSSQVTQGGRPSVWDGLLKLSGTVEGLPPDMAENHDHYLYGTPKKR